MTSGERAVLALRRHLRYPADDTVADCEATAGRDQVPPNPDNWLTLPDWAQFLIALGSAVALHQTDSARLIAAVATPNRAYTAALSAVGAVLARIGTMPPVNHEAHYRYLTGLPKGTTVVYWSTPTFKKTGLLVGCLDMDGQRYVKIELGGTRKDVSYVRADQCGKIQLAKRQLVKLPARAATRRVQVYAGLAAAVLTAHELGEFLSESRPECAIVGSEGQLRREILESPFAILDTFSGAVANSALGSLQDILRVPQFGHEGQCSWVEVHPFLAESRPRRSSETPPRVVIFDGSSAFLKCRGEWPGSSWIAILDRTDPRFEDATSEIDRCYATNPNSQAPILRLPNAPPDLDRVVFEEGH